MAFRREIDYDLLDLSEDELFNKLGSELKERESSGPDMYSPSYDEYESNNLRERLNRKEEEKNRNISLGRRLFNANRELLYSEICVRFNYCEKRREYKDVNSAYYAIMGVISTWNIPFGIGSILGAILIKKKLEKFCKCGY